MYKIVFKNSLVSFLVCANHPWRLKWHVPNCISFCVGIHSTIYSIIFMVKCSDIHIQPWYSLSLASSPRLMYYSRNGIYFTYLILYVLSMFPCGGGCSIIIFLATYQYSIILIHSFSRGDLISSIVVGCQKCAIREDRPILQSVGIYGCAAAVSGNALQCLAMAILSYVVFDNLWLLSFEMAITL